MSLHVVILAAGLGKRMVSDLPKVLHPLGGKTLLSHVIATAQSLSPSQIHVVIGHQAVAVKDAHSDAPVNWVLQPDQLGTGHAVAQVLPFLNQAEWVLVLFADGPLITTKTLQKLVDASQPKQLGLLTAVMPDPSGLGRVLRNADDEVVGIVEEKDADPQQKEIKEIFTGILCAPRQKLEQWLPHLTSDNNQHEYYLTDILAVAQQEGVKIADLQTTDLAEVQGINDRWQLAQLEREYQRRIAKQLAEQGVSFYDPNRFDCRGQIKTGRDVTIDVNVVIEGNNIFGEGIKIGSNCYLKNVRLGDRVMIEPFSHIEDAVIGADSTVGPFARIRPGTELGQQAKIGNFVEIKKTQVGKGSKISHLSYIGDAEIGESVNIGAGTITCNYDGVNKFKTIIEDEAFIGSDSQLIAPIRVGARATIGAGTTLRKDAPADQLTINDTKQKSYPGWKRPSKK